jgi:hypothetical protein
VPQDLREGLSFHFVTRIQDALAKAFVENPWREEARPGELAAKPALPTLGTTAAP